MALLERVLQGEKAAEEGRAVSQAQAVATFEEWLKNRA
jgi:hypothetical protein